MKEQSQPNRFRISDFLEVMTTSRMANTAPLWAYTMVRHAIFGSLRGTWAQGRLLSAWNRGLMEGHPVLGDQVAVPTKSARLCTEAAHKRVRVVVARKASFAGTSVRFDEVIDQAGASRTRIDPRGASLEHVDTVILCTGYRTDFTWLTAEGLDWSPRSWFKHCFPPGWGDKLMFLGWARPHQGGIPACAEMLSRYIAMILDGRRALPADYAERTRAEGATEDAYYLYAKESKNLVDYFAFMESVARLIGCHPDPPSWSTPQRRIQYWMYPNWSIWYRMNGPDARPDVVERVLEALPLGRAYLPNPFILMALTFSLMQLPIDAWTRPRTGLEGRWTLKAKKFLLHGNA
jgi:dimethylaniline monooxygenase (N-oxide forming)